MVFKRFDEICGLDRLAGKPAVINHRLTGARQIESPNFSDRCVEADISLLVIHNISLPPQQYGGCYIDDFFCNRLQIAEHSYFKEIAQLRVSSHLLIRRDGLVHQYVPFDKQAWHAGVSHYCGRDNCNDFSIGIELEGSDLEAFEDIQYQTLVEITHILMKSYPALKPERIVGHSDIAVGRKTDPGPWFDWEKYRTRLVE